MPNKFKELLTIPFYLFVFTLSIILVNVFIIFWTNQGLKTLNASSFYLPDIIIFTINLFGIFFCLSSILLYTYANFFEKSFPSCSTIKNNKELTGIYKYIRHPSFYVYFFITFGTACALNNILLFILACINHVCLYIYYAIEEKQYSKENIYYKEYLKRTNRFLPRF